MIGYDELVTFAEVKITKQKELPKLAQTSKMASRWAPWENKINNNYFILLYKLQRKI